MRTPTGRLFSEYTPDYLARAKQPLDRRFLAVESTAKPRPQVHAIEAETFGAVAKRVAAGMMVETLCGLPVRSAWRFIARGEATDPTPVTCLKCRRLSGSP